MSGPVLALGIAANGVDQVKQLADAVALLDRNLANLQSRSGSSAGTASLGGLDSILSEVQRIRQGMGEAAAGLRTEMADLKQTVVNSINGTMSAIGNASQRAAKEAGDQVESSFDAFKAKLMVGSEKIVAAQSLAAQREEAANNNFIFRANKSLNSFLQQRQDEAAKVARSAQEVEAAYAAASKASQLRSQLGARAQLDQGIPQADVSSRFGQTATLAASTKDVAGLRKEIENAAHSMDGFSLATAGAKRELLVIFGEVVRGNYTRLASSIDVLIRQSGATNYVFSLTALAIAASAAAALAAAAAYAKGTFELHAFEKQATLTGGAIGISASQFTQVRDSLEGIGVTKGKAAEALTAIAATGLIAGTNVRSIADAAIQLERAAGIPIEKTVKNFEDLAKRPAEASAKLNETYHYLTASVYEQILALEKHGKSQEAAALAEQTYADAMTSRAQRIIDSQGYLEKGWHGIANAAKSAWDAMLDLGREDSMADKLRKSTEAMEAAQRRLALAKGFQTTATGAAVGVRGVVSGTRAQADLDAAQSANQDAFRRAQIEDSNAASGIVNARSTEAAAEFSRRVEQYASRDQRLQREIDQIVNSGKEGGKSQKEIDAAVAAARSNFERGSGESASGILGRADTARAQTKRYNELADKGDFLTDPHLTEAESQLNTIREKLKVTTDGLKRAELLRAQSAAESAVGVERDEKAAKKHYEAMKADAEQIAKAADANISSADSIRQKTDQVEQENATLGKNKTAIEQANLALVKHQLAEADSSDSFDPKYVASLRIKTKAQEDYVKALEALEAHQEQKKLDEALRVAQEETKSVAQEYELLGLSAEQRDRILAQRKAELELAKQIADIDKLNLGDGPEADTKRQAMKDEARATARLNAENAASKKIYEQWRKTSDDINKTLTDALVNGFEHGKNAAAQLRDAVKKMFNEMVLRPIIQGIMAPMTGSLAQYTGSATTSLLNNFGAGSNSGGSLLNLFGGGSSAASGAVNLGTATGADMDLFYGGADALSGGAIGSTLGGGSGLAAGASALGSYMPYVGAALSASQGKYGQAAGMAIGTAIMPGIGTAIGAVAGAVIDSFSQKHGPKVESNYGNSIGRGDPAGAKAIADSIQQQYASVAGAFGVSTQLSNLQVGFAKDPSGTAKTQLNIAGGSYERARMYGGNIENVGRTDAEFSKAVSDSAAQLIVKNLQAALGGGALADFVRSINVATVTANSADFLRLQKVATERTTLQQRLDALTARQTSAETQLAAARQKEMAATDALNQDLLQRVYAQENLIKAGQDLVAAYGAQESALNSVTSGVKSQITELQNYAKALRTWVGDAMTGEASPLNAMEKLQQASQDFETTLAKAHGGDADARSALTGKAGTYLTNLRDTSATRLDYAMGFAKVTSALTLEASSADSQATLLQQQVDLQQAQLDAAKAQLQQLGLISGTVMSWADAWAAYQAAKTQAAQLEATAAVAAAVAAAQQPVASAAPAYTAPTSTPTPASYALVSEVGMNDGDGAAFADGGYHSGGMRLVGENGPELEYTGPSYIQDAMTTKRILSGGGSTQSAVVEAIQGMRDELRANVGFTFQLAKDIRELKQRGFPMKNTEDGQRVLVSQIAG